MPTLNDERFEALGALGHTVARSEAELKFWITGGVLPAVLP